jgi:tRNA threonylcarbamoyladenosine biosynthesis protein TsaB
MNLILRDMTDGDLEIVSQIERQIHLHPWTLGNFKDALASAYVCKIAELDGKTIGYAVLMQGVDEAELLDIGITLYRQRLGWGRKLLQAIVTQAQELDKQRVVLEVRASNAPAIGLYQSIGFVKIGLRRDYYPVENSNREDAILMGLVL